MDTHAIIAWFKEQNWFILGPALVGYLNVVVAGSRVMGWTQLADFCGKLEDAIQAMVNAALNKNKISSSVEPVPVVAQAPVDKIMPLILFALLSMSLVACPRYAHADTPPAAITTALDKLTLNQGVIYTIKANSVAYTMTTDLVKWKGASIIAGYSTAAKAVAGLDYDLMNLKGIDIPILKYVDVHVGWAATWDNIGGRNLIDNGPVITIAQLSF